MHTFVALKLRSLESNHLKNGYFQRGLSRANVVVKKTSVTWTCLMGNLDL